MTVTSMAKYHVMENTEIELRVRQLVRDIVLLLKTNGIHTISIGGILRVLGVPNDVAQKHDEEYMEIVDDSDDQIDEIIPPGTTFH